MTTARWVSLITGCLCMFGSLIPKEPDVFDVILKVAYYAVATVLVITPLVLEFLERSKE